MGGERFGREGSQREKATCNYTPEFVLHLQQHRSLLKAEEVTQASQ